MASKAETCIISLWLTSLIARAVSHTLVAVVRRLLSSGVGGASGAGGASSAGLASLLVLVVGGRAHLGGSVLDEIHVCGCVYSRIRRKCGLVVLRRMKVDADVENV